MEQDRERFYSRLAQIPGVETMPSIGDWILVRVERPSDLARRVSRRVAPGLMSVPRHVKGAVRIQVSDAKTNEEILGVIRESVA